MSGVGERIRLYLRLAGASARGQMQYKTSFAIRTAVDFAVVLSDFAPVYLLVRRFGMLHGWSFAELALLYGMVGTSWGCVETVLRGFEGFAPILVRGELDRCLLRPRGILLQIASFQFETRKLGRVAQALVVLAAAALVLELDARALAFVALGVAGGVAFFAGVVILGAATQFFTLGQSSELQNMLTYGGAAALSYPISVYATWFRRVAVYGVPLAFVNYFPALAALERTQAAGWPAWLPWLSPFVCSAVLLAATRAFAAGLRRYESTGT